MEKDLVFGLKCGEQFAQYDPKSQSLKMWGPLLGMVYQSSYQILPKSGMMRNGRLYRQEMWVHSIKEKGLGLFAIPNTMGSLPAKSKDALMKEATISRKNRSRPANLRDQICNKYLWPTPKSIQRGGTSLGYGDDLIERIKKIEGIPCRKYPTPNARDCTRDTSPKKDRLSDIANSNIKTGQLNPDWVDWLMGYPVGYTDIEKEDKDLIQYNISKEPNIPRLTMKKENRKDRLKCLGNSVVPQITELLFNQIKKIL